MLPTVTNSKIYSNTASYGGGIYVGGTTNLTNVVLEGNLAANGAGIASRGILTMTNGLIVGNKATTYGGGFYNEGTATFTGVVISKNVVTTNQFPYGGIGGGISNMGNMVVSNSTIISNTAGNHSGGILAGSNTTIVNTFIVSNTAGYSGAMYGAGNLVVRESTISGNTAVVSAGISNGGNATLTNVTVSGNTAQGMAGIDNGGYITLTNVTLSGNQATNPNGNASSIYNGYHADSFVRIKNTIVATGGSVNNCKTAMGLGIISEGHNLSNDSSCNLIAVGDQPNTNPLLGSLANNGGATQTHALLSGSPAINAGDNNGCPPTDQRGQSRIGECDIGAYEYRSSTAVAVASFTVSKAETMWSDANIQVLSVIAIGGIVAIGGLWALRR